MAQDGIILTEGRVIGMERKKEKLESHGEIETAHPGYLIAQETYYMNIIKGVGPIYQQTVIDTYSRRAFGKLYTSKHAITSADVLNHRVIPFFDEHAIAMVRMLTERGTEYNGRPKNHEYERYLQLENIDHTTTKVRHPQTNGICERLHRKMQDEFYAVTFRRKIYQDLESLQIDHDQWPLHYNDERLTVDAIASEKHRCKQL